MANDSLLRILPGAIGMAAGLTTFLLPFSSKFEIGVRSRGGRRRLYFSIGANEED
jgi:hypothetical protein